ncbi:putative membrane protein [Poseidonocella pacifica]|uniref:Putative membrane protein n=1 Tax=Poseidonocella pacifica TaxID=871651 RepID=A0A1I0VIQ4_9RHOB|nr:TIGR01620 family protein [Poseidonocella pacifica]SFA76078.1 putative membrane protein [Poseidonocella pacifica]
MSERRGPVLIDIDESAPQAETPRGPVEAPTNGPAPNPADAPPIPDPGEPGPSGQAMQTLAILGARRRSWLGRLFWSLLGAVVTAMISLAFWQFVTDLIDRLPVLGWALSALLVAFLLTCLGLILREFAAFSRLGKVDALHRRAEAILAEDDLEGARGLVADLNRFYAHRPETEWGRDRLARRSQEELDAASLLALADGELLSDLDKMAEREVQAAARQVATVTALVPLAFADVAAAGAANMRMIRRVAEIYGGRAGGLATWRLTRSVLTHLVATGAVAVGDDMLEPILGGTILARLSRRFGEGIVNGALTVRVGIAAMEVCRPLPFAGHARPSVRRLVRRALAGLIPGQ